MNRPDLDLYERLMKETGNGLLRRPAQDVIAYARHLERQLLNEVEYVNIQNEDFGKVLTQAQVYARRLEARITELEAALGKIANDQFGDEYPADVAIRVLRKGE